jgi:hypothetical protein
MLIPKSVFLFVMLLWTYQICCAISLAEQFKQVGYVEMCDTQHGAATYDSLYASFDTLIAFLQTNPV